MKRILIYFLLIAPLSVFGQYTICFDQVGITNGPGTGTPTNPIVRFPFIRLSYDCPTTVTTTLYLTLNLSDGSNVTFDVPVTLQGTGTKLISNFAGMTSSGDPNGTLTLTSATILFIRLPTRKLITLANGVCSGSDCCVIDQPTVCNFQVSTNTSPITCSRQGQASVTVTGGTPPYTYLWSNGSTGGYYTYFPNPGTYRVTVSDASNCKSISTVIMTECQDCGTVATTQNATCSSNGSIDLALYILKIHFPVTLKWSDGVINVISSYSDLSNSALIGRPPSQYGTGIYTRQNVLPGTYTVEIINAGGKCKRTATVAKDCDCKEVVNQCKTEWEQEFWRRYGGSACKNWETDCNTTADIRRNGKVAIGLSIKTVPDGFNLGVEGGVIANEVKVQTCRTAPNGAWCDYVFDEKYKLKPLLEVSSYLKANKRLHNMPSTADIDKAGGYDLGKIALLQQEKVEEIYLHLISLNEKVIALNTRIEQKKQANSRLKKRIQKMK